MNFKEWLLNESPDKLWYNKSLIKWTSGQTFYLFNNYSLFTPKSGSLPHTHNDIISNLYKLYKAIILPAYKKEISLAQLDHSLKEDAGLLSHGTINQDSLELIIEMIKAYSSSSKLFNPIYPDEYHRNSFSEIKEWPDIILGRIWSDIKIISFWNRAQYVFQKSNQIINFLSNFGDPKEYQYEIRGADGFLIIDYDSFLNRQVS